MREIKTLTDNKFLNIKEVCDPDNHVRGYQFAERRGVDSIAFICYDPEDNSYLVNYEFKPPIDKFLYTAFGGSLDKDANYLKIVTDEVKEEAGFEVDEKDVYFVGRVFVSTQMNQYCYLYLVKVSKKNQGKTEPENEVEAMAKPTWMHFGVDDLDDWKAITIVAKARKMELVK